MYTQKTTVTALLFFGVFVLQVMLFDQVHVPFGGFSLFLIFALCWSALSSPEMGAISGFFAGIFMDLAPSSSGPVGQWTLILVLIGFGIAFLRYGDDSLRTNPLSLVVIVAFAASLAFSSYALVSFLLGSDLGSGAQLTRTIIGNGLWTLAVAPFVLPIVSRLHGAVFETREMA